MLKRAKRARILARKKLGKKYKKKNRQKQYTSPDTTFRNKHKT